MHEARLKSTIQPNNYTRQSAVLILFYPFQNQAFVPLILRPAYDGTHGGQMALPGGKIEPSDENLIRTALREAQEEIGIKAIDVSILGKLTDVYIPVSNFNVLPVVGTIPYRPEFFPDATEVEKIFEISILDLLANENIEFRNVHVPNGTMNVPGFDVHGQWLWGATALIFQELKDLILS
ncbi:MAG: CoA pyrophosphatase [Cytophagaceae bacterium]|nr:CoA pyrophosphatase [Cytophagaceae bacterium]MBK9508289.1 CoA pyrophosphatase [Cytophagaceae bacterium]MBK9933985.1 CoA pyrophosphatase [Cytophagaceae bacterium]MBL0300441.1 CoA pyrophosphatase [Cytophagaceae bacterium]MBL0327375.1 CoA pyrophosphatase [Cytophagaceae bacterium]